MKALISKNSALQTGHLRKNASILNKVFVRWIICHPKLKIIVFNSYVRSAISTLLQIIRKTFLTNQNSLLRDLTIVTFSNGGTA